MILSFYDALAFHYRRCNDILFLHEFCGYVYVHQCLSYHFYKSGVAVELGLLEVMAIVVIGPRLLDHMEAMDCNLTSLAT